MKKLILLAIILLSIGTALALTTDFLQIGDATSEDARISGFGPIEPDTHGGNWGGMVSSLELSPSDNKCRVAWEGTEGDTNEGRSAHITLDNPEKPCWKNSNKMCAKPAKTLILRVLDGQADDNFMVFAECGEKPKTCKDPTFLIYEYDGKNTGVKEEWKTHEIDMAGVPNWCRVKPMTFRIMATGNAWADRSTYGQLAIDYAELE